jgi:hypothetical protein
LTPAAINRCGSASCGEVAGRGTPSFPSSRPGAITDTRTREDEERWNRTKTPNRLNGIDVDGLRATAIAIRPIRKKGMTRWGVTTRWTGGTRPETRQSAEDRRQAHRQGLHDRRRRAAGFRDERVRQPHGT